LARASKHIPCGATRRWDCLLHLAYLISLRETADADAALIIAADGRDALLPPIAARRPAETAEDHLIFGVTSSPKICI
jgi:hypothetical protein